MLREARGGDDPATGSRRLAAHEIARQGEERDIHLLWIASVHPKHSGFFELVGAHRSKIKYVRLRSTAGTVHSFLVASARVRVLLLYAKHLFIAAIVAGCCSTREAMMSDRENSPAYQMLPRSARRVFAAIERTIGDGSSASVSYTDFRLDHHIARKAVSPSLKLLDHLGLIEIEPGPRLVNVFRFSNRWRTVDEVEAARLAALAREVKPHRTFEKRREPKPVKPPKPMPP